MSASARAPAHDKGTRTGYMARPPAGSSGWACSRSESLSSHGGEIIYPLVGDLTGKGRSSLYFTSFVTGYHGVALNLCQ